VGKPALVAPPPVVVVAAPFSDSLMAIEKEQGAEIAALRKEIADAKKIAMEAERRRELTAAKPAPPPAKGTVAVVATAEPPHAHLFVMVKGGVPGVLVDGKQMADRSPAVIEVSPGRHSVTVQSAAGSQEFLPLEYNVDLAPNDTEQVVFMSARAAAAAAQSAKQRKQTGGDASAAAAAMNSPGTSVAGPTAPDPSNLTPEQRQKAQQFVRRINGRTAPHRP
jgi:hypothetical protein